MFLYRITNKGFACDVCGNSLTRRNLEKICAQRGASFECVICGTMHIYINDFELGYRIIDETSDELPKPFDQYLIPEGFLSKDVDKTGVLSGVVWNHAGSNCEDKFAFGKGITTKSPEQIIFDDMDKTWE